MKINKFIKELDRSHKVYLISHINPDGDSIGSLLGLGLGLIERYNNKIVMVKSDNIPSKFKFLAGINLLKTTDFIHKKYENSILITLDCGDLKRIGKLYDDVSDFNKIINIDHHKSNENYGDINYVYEKSSSTCEVVYNILKELKINITKEIATSLYLGISTDTGSFKYDNTTSETHKIASELLDYNINQNMIIKNAYQNRSINKTRLFIEALNKLQFYYDNNVGISCIDMETIENLDVTSEHFDGIVEFIRDTEGIEVACVLREIKHNTIKVSLRSKNDIDVSNIAKSFNGGGHRKAAGCTVEGNLIETKEKVLEQIKNSLR